MSEWFGIKRGVGQGCVISPNLFNILAEVVMRETLDDLMENDETSMCWQLHFTCLEAKLKETYRLAVFKQWPAGQIQSAKGREMARIYTEEIRPMFSFKTCRLYLFSDRYVMLLLALSYSYFTKYIISVKFSNIIKSSLNTRNAQNVCMPW